MKTKYILWIAAAVALGALAFFLFKPASGGIRNVDAGGVDQAIAAGAQVIDVRTPGEYEMGHIPGAVNVPVEEISQAAGSWDRDARYVVYCATGARSATAVQTMQQMGFKNIDHFSAGVVAYPPDKLQKGGNATSQKIETNGKPVFVEFFTDS